MKRCGFVGLPPQTPLGETVLDREEASALLTKLEKQGHVHLAFYGFTMFADAPSSWARATAAPAAAGSYTARGSAGVADGPQKSNYRAVIDAESCTACGACIKRCPVDAIVEGPNHPSRTPAARAATTGVVAQHVGRGPGQVHRLRRVRDRVPGGGHRDGTGFGRRVVPRSIEHGGMGRKASRISRNAEQVKQVW